MFKCAMCLRLRHTVGVYFQIQFSLFASILYAFFYTLDSFLVYELFFNKYSIKFSSSSTRVWTHYEFSMWIIGPGVNWISWFTVSINWGRLWLLKKLMVFSSTIHFVCVWWLLNFHIFINILMFLVDYYWAVSRKFSF